MKTELRIPSIDDIDAVYSNVVLEEDGYLNYDEYLVILFKVTQENYGE
jgi:hypothetical protein